MSTALAAAAATDVQALRDLYLNLLKKSLTHSLWFEAEDEHLRKPRGTLAKLAMNTLIEPDLRKNKKSLEQKTEGRIWPQFAHTMIGFPRLENLEMCVRSVIADDIQGDFIETGVWRGGACIFMRGILKAFGVTDRKVWVADSFQGLPPPDVDKAPRDKGDRLYKYTELAISLETVQSNFSAYDLLDEQVKFLKGWFKDTLPTAPIKQLAVCRLDGDMYESTMDGLINLYPKLSVGGYLIVDDYGAIGSCKHAVHDYRDKHQITDEIHQIDWTGVYWRKER